LNLHSEYLTKEALEGSGDFKIEGKVIRTLNYGDDLVLLAEEEAVL
jgi:ABC-type iron transport system FetAB ATPase subunit